MVATAIKQTWRSDLCAELQAFLRLKESAAALERLSPFVSDDEYYAVRLVLEERRLK